MSPPTVVAREPELDRLREFLTGGESRALVLRGEPGIGKTLLWQAGVDDAVARGRRVLVHRAVEAEAALAYTGLSDLAGTLLEEVGDDLPAPRRRALSVALMLDDPGDAPPPAQLIGLALLDVLTALCVQGEVLVAIDDLQWLDSSTAGVLPVALRRFADARLKVLATVREAPGVHAAFELRTLFGEERAAEIRLAALDVSALHRLLADRLGLELARPELLRVHELSGGNPLFALELGREMGQSGGLRVPASLREALDARLERLPQRTAEVLLTASALARPTIDLVAPDPDAQSALDDAIAAGVVTLDGDVVRFTHPLLASRCYERASPWTRRAMHRAVADHLDDVEQRARHLALAGDGPDEAIAAQLDEAVAQAAARGATAAAAELADLAVAATPGDTIRRRFAAAHFHHLAGDFTRANAICARLADDLPPGMQRADALYLRALIGREDMPERARLCEEALRDAHGDDERCAYIHGFQAVNRWILEDVATGLVEARAGLSCADRVGDFRTTAVALARVGLIETWAMEMTPGLLERGLEIEAHLPDPLLFSESPAYFLAVRLMEIGELHRARTMFERYDAGAAERGDEHSRQWCALQLTEVEGYFGNLHRALQHAGVARDIVAQTGEPQFPAMIERAASFVEANSGSLDEARASAHRSIAHARAVCDGIQSISARAALGHAELVAGDLEGAADHLRELPARQRRAGHFSPSCDPWGDTIEALIGLGELDAAQEHLDCYRMLPSIAYRYARVGAARNQALLHAARGDKDTAVSALHEALAVDDPPVYRLERGRTLLALGAVQRQALQRRAARETLTQAIELFESLGARPWAEKARVELGRISGRGAAASDELTNAERHVAALAAEGRRNKEIAAAMFVTVGTVEAHLSRVYRKLGVRSRAELAGRFGRDGAAKARDSTTQS
jgi:DNA-binding CsgD family transcriptional regulator